MKFKMKCFLPFFGLFAIMNEAMASSSFHTQTSSAPATQDKFWPNGFVYYKISDEFSSEEQSKIYNAMNEISQKNPKIRFIPKLGQIVARCNRMNPPQCEIIPATTNYIHFKNGSNCSSLVGMQGGEQIISLNTSFNHYCLDKNTILHEIMHALGFYHEQQRYDRDQHIIINWNNMNLNNARSSPDFVSLGEFTTRFGNYDYNSIMHYSSYAYAFNNGQCSKTRRDGSRISRKTELSQGDIDGLKRAYP